MPGTPEARDRGQTDRALFHNRSHHEPVSQSQYRHVHACSAPGILGGMQQDKSDLTDAGRSTLQKQAAWLQRFGAVTLAIEGHCDERGTREYNLALGARRAQAVKDYLGSLGVAGARLETISFGKERPVCVESNDACYQQNRRGVSTIKSGAVS